LTSHQKKKLPKLFYFEREVKTNLFYDFFISIKTIPDLILCWLNHF